MLEIDRVWSCENRELVTCPTKAPLREEWQPSCPAWIFPVAWPDIGSAMRSGKNLLFCKYVLTIAKICTCQSHLAIIWRCPKSLEILQYPNSSIEDVRIFGLSIQKKHPAIKGYPHDELEGSNYCPSPSWVRPRNSPEMLQEQHGWLQPGSEQRPGLSNSKPSGLVSIICIHIYIYIYSDLMWCYLICTISATSLGQFWERSVPPLCWPLIFADCLRWEQTIASSHGYQMDQNMIKTYILLPYHRRNKHLIW